MTESRDPTEVSGNVTMEQHTETSPLKRNDGKKNWFYRLLLSPVSDQEQSSLKTIILNFFAFTVVVTVALLVQLYYGKFMTIEGHGSVASDSYECSKIGVNILKKGGNSVDAAIASTMCLGVVNFHITGLGGNGYMMIYNHRNVEVLDIIDFQGTVPISLVNKKIDTSIEGLTVGVPGLLMGLWEAHQKYGKISWEEVIKPALNLAKNGFKVSKNVISAFSHINTKSNNNKNLKQLLSLLTEGENIKFPALAATLELIAATGVNEFYNGSLAMDIVHSVKEANGSMNINDLSQYKTSRSELLHTKFGNFNVLASGSSSGGALLLNALDSIQFLDLTSDDDFSSIVLKISDVLHDSYMSFLYKNNAVPNELEFVASHVSVTDNEDLYVVIVSGLNTWLGSQLLTEAGFILNNAAANGGINEEGKPFSLSAPVVAIESDEICGRRLVLGSGDVTIAAQVLTYVLLFNRNISSSIESPRFFVDSVPRHIWVENMHIPFFDPLTLKKLSSLTRIEGILPPYKSINVIEIIDDAMTAYSDSRGGGSAFQNK